MKICGIVTEYNPFHNGHAYHIQKAKEATNCDVLIAIMSGNFVQRGECAITDKWARAKAAISAGCDLVIELPYPFVVQRADIFAKHAVDILDIAGINSLVFGSETSDIEHLSKLANTTYEEYQKQRKNGISMAKTLEKIHGKVNSNDILGMAYLRAVTNKNITPIAIQRTNGYHDQDINNTISSATAIRKAIKEGNCISHTTSMSEYLTNPVFMEDYYPYIQTLLLTTSKEELRKRFLVDEGIENLFVKQANIHMDWESFITSCISNRYPRSSIQRSLIHILTQTNKYEIDTLPTCDFLRVLAFNDIGRKHLKHLKKQEIKIAASFHQIPQPYRDIFIRITNAYAYAFDTTKRKEIMDSEVQSPIYISSCGSY